MFEASRKPLFNGYLQEISVYNNFYNLLMVITAEIFFMINWGYLGKLSRTIYVFFLLKFRLNKVCLRKIKITINFWTSLKGYLPDSLLFGEFFWRH